MQLFAVITKVCMPFVCHKKLCACISTNLSSHALFMVSIPHNVGSDFVKLIETTAPRIPMVIPTKKRHYRYSQCFMIEKRTVAGD